MSAFDCLRRNFLADNVVDATWDIRFLGFVREANLQKLKDTFKGESGVAFYPIKQAILEYNYSERRPKEGPPR